MATSKMSRDNFAQWLYSAAVSTMIIHAAEVYSIVVRICECGHDYDHHHTVTGMCEVCGCPEYSGA